MTTQNSIKQYEPNCPCPNTSCPRHTHCEECEAHHAEPDKQPPYCQRKTEAIRIVKERMDTAQEVGSIMDSFSQQNDF